MPEIRSLTTISLSVMFVRGRKSWSTTRCLTCKCRAFQMHRFHNEKPLCGKPFSTQYCLENPFPESHFPSKFALKTPLWKAIFHPVLLGKSFSGKPFSIQICFKNPFVESHFSSSIAWKITLPEKRCIPMKESHLLHLELKPPLVSKKQSCISCSEMLAFEICKGLNPF